MPFDDATRGRLQTFVGAARDLLTEEFARQFQQDYGLDPGSGEVAGLDSLGILDDQRLETARILRDILQHYLGALVNRLGAGPPRGAGPHGAGTGLHHAEPAGRAADDGGARAGDGVRGQGLPVQGLPALPPRRRIGAGRDGRCLPRVPAQPVRHVRR